jgi:hypothetical protein
LEFNIQKGLETREVNGNRLNPHEFKERFLKKIPLVFVADSSGEGAAIGEFVPTLWVEFSVPRYQSWVVN